MATLTSKQLKDSYQGLLTIKTADDANPLSGRLENGKGNAITNLGIGIDSGLVYPLTIKEDTNNSYIHFVNSTTGSLFSDGTQIGVPSGQSDFLINNRESANIRLFTSGSEKVRIDSSGNVGIGVTPKSWTTWNPIQIGQASTFAGRILANQTDVANNWYYDGAEKRINAGYAQRYVQDANGDHYWMTAGTSTADSTISFSTPMIIKNSGNVGIGTTSPQQKLQIGGSGGTLAGTAAISFGDSNSGGSRNWAIANGASATGIDQIGALTISQSNAQGGDALTAGTERMRIDSSGNVGIGTDSPASKLYVNAGSDNYAAIFESTDATSLISFKDNNSASILANYVGVITNDLVFGTNSTESMRIDSSGNVGIGTAPDSILHAKGASALLTIENTTAGSGGSPNYSGIFFIQSDGVSTGASIQSGDQLNSNSNNDLIFTTRASGGGSHTEKLRITGDGNVTITTGNLILDSGAGIDFSDTPNSSGTMTSELLDDYEEGTFTPALNNFTLGNGTSTGLYTKIGNLVTIQFSIVLGSTSVMGGATTISGLPFTSSNFLSGYVDILDSGAKQFSMVASNYTSSANFSIRGLRSDTTYVESFIISATTPMTWTTGDSITGQLFYRVA